jgi:hypothetical protein
MAAAASALIATTASAWALDDRSRLVVALRAPPAEIHITPTVTNANPGDPKVLFP